MSKAPSMIEIATNPQKYSEYDSEVSGSPAMLHAMLMFLDADGTLDGLDPSFATAIRIALLRQSNETWLESSKIGHYIQTEVTVDEELESGIEKLANFLKENDNNEDQG